MSKAAATAHTAVCLHNCSKHTAAVWLDSALTAHWPLYSVHGHRSHARRVFYDKDSKEAKAEEGVPPKQQPKLSAEQIHLMFKMVDDDEEDPNFNWEDQGGLTIFIPMDAYFGHVLS